MAKDAAEHLPSAPAAAASMFCEMTGLLMASTSDLLSTAHSVDVDLSEEWRTRQGIYMEGGKRALLALNAAKRLQKDFEVCNTEQYGAGVCCRV